MSPMNLSCRKYPLASNGQKPKRGARPRADPQGFCARGDEIQPGWGGVGGGLMCFQYYCQSFSGRNFEAF